MGRGVIDLGLERVRKLLCLAGHPTQGKNVVHVVGTNGKGSATVNLANGFATANVRAGLFVSPHFIEPRDAWQLRMTEESGKLRIMLPTCEERITLITKLDKICRGVCTNFEIEFVACMLWIASAEPTVQIIVVEAGLGGRHDATNVFDGQVCEYCTTIPPCLRKAAAAVVVTPISLDHVDRLGGTVSEIAANKLDALHAATDVCVVLPQEHPIEVEAAIDARIAAFGNGVNVIKLESNLSLLQQRQDLVAAALEACSVESCNLVSRARKPEEKLHVDSHKRQWLLPGRLSKVWIPALECEALLDGAHNPSACHRLREHVDTVYGTLAKRLWVLAASGGRDIGAHIDILMRPGDALIATEFNTPVEGMAWVTSTPAAKIADIAAARGFPVLITASSITDITCKKLVSGFTITIVTGSLYLVADAYRSALQSTSGVRLEDVFEGCLEEPRV